MPTAYHMVHYRRFDAGNYDLKGETLETLCRSALNTAGDGTLALWQRPEDRLFDIGKDDGRRIFLNKIADLSSAVFGEMCLAQSHDMQALLNMKPSKVQLSDLTMAVIYDLNEREAPSGSQFIRGLAYWLAIGNHVFFVKTHSMTAELLRLYLDWLLKTRTSAGPTDLEFVLQAELDQTKSAGDIGDILRTRMPFNLPHEGSNLLEFDNVADQLQEVYMRFVKDGKIKAYKTAWFMAHRLREAMRVLKIEPLGGEFKVVEADETYIGGKEKNKHANKRIAGGQGGATKEPVLSLVERKGKVRSFHMPQVTAKTLRPVIEKHMHMATHIMSDDSKVYPGAVFGMKHSTVIHSC